MSEELFIDGWNTNLDLITEAKDLDGSKPVVLEGKMQHGNVKGGNGRVYLTEHLAKNVDRLQGSIKSRSLYGECDHPNVAIVKYQNVSHLITEAKMDGDAVYGKYQILRDHPMGKIILACLKEGGNIGTSSRALGQAKPAQVNGEMAQVIGKDMKVITWDLVVDNSMPGCDNWQQINESMIHYIADSMAKDTPKTQEKKLRNLVSKFLYGK